MTRNEAIAQITSNAAQLGDDQLEALAEYTAYLAGPSVYSTLPQVEKDKIEEALDRLDAGEGIPGEKVFSELEARIASAKARA